MRDAFVTTITEIAHKDPDMFLVTGDLGFGVFAEFSKLFPKRFINAGVAEQQMIAVSVGMALEGKKIFAYSIGNFATLRCLEQIRNDACYHKASITIAATGGGFSYGPLGFSHHATEDLAILRSIPNMNVFAPGDPHETTLAVKECYSNCGPNYLRLGRNGEPLIHTAKNNFDIKRAVKISEGNDVLIISSGGILKNAWDAAETLKKEGVSTGLYSLPTIKPLDVESIKEAAHRYKLIITIEEHSISGGLGGCVAEVLAELSGPKARLKRIGLPEILSSVVGDQDYLRRYYGLTAQAIVDAVNDHLDKGSEKYGLSSSVR